MPPTVLWHLLQATCAVLGAVVVICRIRHGRRTCDQWLALAGCCAWAATAVTEAVWPLLEAVGGDADIRRLLVNLGNVVVILVVSLGVTRFGIWKRARPSIMLAALAAGLLVWWLPGHGAVVERREQSNWEVWLGLVLYFTYVAATGGSLRELGRCRARTELTLPQLMCLRLLHAVVAAALACAGIKALLFVGVQLEWRGFSALWPSTYFPWRCSDSACCLCWPS